MSKKREQLPLEVIERALKDSDWCVRRAAMNACQGKDVPLEIIERGLKDSDWCVRKAAMNACQGKDVPWEVIERGLKDSDWYVRQAAMNACQGKDVPLEIIERGLKDSDWCIRQAAMNACQGKDVPLEIIERGLKDSDCDVRKTAMKIYKERGISFPVIRTIEPPKTVFKKCLGQVIVCATIPDDAEVRGTAGHKCRTNKAIITKVIGDFGGEPVGVSAYDKVTTYYEGDIIEVDDFDYSIEECSTGFHFF